MFLEELSHRKNKVDDFLSAYFESEDESSIGLKKLVSATKYSLLQNGKRFRPALCLMTAEAFGVGPQRILPLAAAIEMIHTYSLIHDDLPCMDNDDFRRGEPTNHKVYGEDFALLAGDALLTEAFLVLATGYAEEPRLVQKTVQLLSQAAGMRGMIAGQSMDIGQKEFTFEELKKTHALKTGALIRLSCEATAFVCGIPQEKIELCREFGEYLGFAFQIKDDLLDEEKEEKSSYLRILGKAGTQDLLEKTTVLAKTCLKKLNLEDSLLHDLVQYNLTRST